MGRILRKISPLAHVPDNRSCHLKRIRLVTKNWNTMKRIFCNNRLILLAFFTVFSLGSVAAFAGDTETLPVELKYSGQLNNRPLYKLIVAGNAQPDEFTLIIRDSQKNTLFKENIKGGNFTKSFMLNTEEMGDDIFEFEVTSKRTGKSVTYEISRDSHLEETAVIEPK